MSDRYQGGVIRATPLAPTSSSASGIWTMEQQAKAQAAGNWPIPPVTVDPNFNQVSMLLGGEPANNLDYTAFSDASTNNFLLTPSGNPYGTAFSPYNSTFSNYFNGSTDYLTTSSTQVIPTGDFTIEVFVYCTSLASSNQMIVSQASGTTSGRTGLYIESGYYQGQIGSSGDVTTTTAPTLNGWDYVVLRRSGSTFQLYVNGTLAGSSTNANTPENTILSIGRNANWITSYYWNGYISNLKISNVAITVGSTPTSPLTSDANTRILTCQSNRFIDNSANAFAITVNGSTKISGFIPFTDTDTTTGSGYFDGSGDYLTGPSNAAFTLGASGDFTIEFWMYPISTSGTVVPLITTVVDWNSTYANRWGVAIYLGSLIFADSAGSVAINGGAVSVNRWSHVAVARSGSDIKMFVNGTQVGSTYSGADQAYTTQSPVLIGYTPGSGVTTYFNGYMSNSRVVKGTAVYTSNFTPPTSPLTSVSGTSLLTLQDRAANQNFGFLDTSKRQYFPSTSGTPGQGTFSPFSQADGYWSNYCDGSTGYLSTGSSISLGTGDFTVEAYVYVTTASYANIFNIGDDKLSTGFTVYTRPTGEMTLATNNAGVNYGSGGEFTFNEWQQVTITRSGTTFSVYVNGTLVGSSSGVSNNFSGTVRIGAEYYNSTIYVGPAMYFANYRVSNTVRTVSIPTAPYTTDVNTLLLTCQSNRFVDNSANAYAINSTGGVSTQSFGPFAPTDAYDPAVNGGSLYLDGSSYITTSNMGGFGSGDFTVEAWVYSPWIYPSSGQAVPVFIAGTGGEFAFGFFQDALYYGTSETANILSYSVGNQRNNWLHVAVTRSSGTTNLYYNGVRVATNSNSENWAADNYWIGRRGNGSTGLAYITDLRVLNGTALYTGATYTIPTAPLTVVNGTELLCNFTNAGVWDSAARNDLETAGNAQITTSQSKFGSGSYYFDGTGDYLKAPNSPEQQFGTGDFTVEAWIYPTAITGTSVRDIICKGQNASGSFEVAVRDSKIRMYTDVVVFTSTASVTVNTWQHIAITRSGTTLRFFLDGVLDTTVTSFSTNFNETDSLFFGSYGNGSQNYYTGYIDDFRITKGVARYTTNFTPANYPFPVK